jgi:hypothetical protein
MTPEFKTPEQVVPAGDDLLQLEMRIAQRADELRSHAGYPGGTDLIHWMQAEREVLESYLGAREPAAALADAD